MIYQHLILIGIMNNQLAVESNASKVKDQGCRVYASYARKVRARAHVEGLLLEGWIMRKVIVFPICACYAFKVTITNRVSMTCEENVKGLKFETSHQSYFVTGKSGT